MFRIRRAKGKNYRLFVSTHGITRARQTYRPFHYFHRALRTIGTEISAAYRAHRVATDRQSFIIETGRGAFPTIRRNTSERGRQTHKTSGFVARKNERAVQDRKTVRTETTPLAQRKTSHADPLRHGGQGKDTKDCWQGRIKLPHC